MPTDPTPTVAPITDEEAARHAQASSPGSEYWCAWCEQSWPCDASRLREERDALRAKLASVMRDFQIEGDTSVYGIVERLARAAARLKAGRDTFQQKAEASEAQLAAVRALRDHHRTKGQNTDMNMDNRWWHQEFADELDAILGKEPPRE